MFYSPTILAKKSPMGTVWMAAHLERKIKKNQIEKINIAIYAEKLLFPEVPIALRMSAHLLLGLVRIFAWKVDYAFGDCNRLLTDIRSCIVNIKVNLPADAKQALPQSVTLPNNFQLDDIDLDDLADDAGGLDNHQKTFDQITNTDFTAGGEENYVRFVIDEDSSSHSSHSMRGAGPMDDVLPPCSDRMQELITNEQNTEVTSLPTNLGEGETQFQDTFMDNQFEHDPNDNQDNLVENQSDAFHDIPRGNQFNIPNESQSDAFPNENQLHPDISENLHQYSPIEQFRSRHPSPPLVWNSSTGAACQFSPSPKNDSNLARGSFTPIELQLDPTPVLGNQNVPRPPTQRDNDVPSPQSASMQLDEVELVLAPSPPPVREKRKRKKTQFYFDRHIVLSNKTMKEQLKEQPASLLTLKRRKLPSSPVDVWRYQWAHLKSQIFDQQLINWKFASVQEKKTYAPIMDEGPDMQPPVGPTQQSPDHGITFRASINSPVHSMPHCPFNERGTVEEPPVASPVGPPNHSPNHDIYRKEPSINPTVGPSYHSPNYDTYMEEPAINPHVSPTHQLAVDVDEEPERLRCQHVNETMPVSSPSIDLGWNTPNSINDLHNSPTNAFPILEPEVLHSRSTPVKRTRPLSQGLSTPSHKRDSFRTPLRRSAETVDLNFLETPPSVKAKRALIEDGNLSPSVFLGNGSERRDRGSWSARSMGMAKYLREHFNVGPSAEDHNRNISLDHILEGKTRKHCARMFFETLVLTTCEYIHVKQEEAYGDVLITPRPRLAATKN